MNYQVSKQFGLNFDRFKTKTQFLKHEKASIALHRGQLLFLKYPYFRCRTIVFRSADDLRDGERQEEQAAAVPAVPERSVGLAGDDIGGEPKERQRRHAGAHFD